MTALGAAEIRTPGDAAPGAALPARGGIGPHGDVAGPWARFDDLRAGTALLCPPPSRVLIAATPADVAPVLAEVDRATRRGWWAFGYVAYEAASGLDERLVTHAPGAGPPLVWFGLCAEPTRVPVVAPPAHGGRDYRAESWRPGWLPADHHRDVDRVREHIAAGETYQCNLTVRMHSRISGRLGHLYADLALGQRGSYAAYLDLGRFVVASASPELFFEWSGDRLTMRPMKGTATRGRHLTEDRVTADQLRNSAKERAENVMIVDLMRNDVARIAQVGSVTVTSLCSIERFETVLQLTSEVTAAPRPEVGLVDVFRALFPSGSVTGAPKGRTMELIRELEDTPRGVYCGAIGLVAPPEAPVRARFSVAIRTVVVDRSTGRATYGTGGGITWGSDPAAEHEELWAKAAVLDSRYEDFQLLETMAYRRATGLRNRLRHLERMAASAEYFGFPFDATRVDRELGFAVASVDTALIRLRLDRSGAVAVEAAPLPPRLDRPLILAVDVDLVDSTQPWLYHKTSLRSPYATRMRRHPDADDVVMRNERGELTETTTANLAVHLDGRWWTPPLSSGCLPGVERGRLLDSGVLRERTVLPADLPRAEALAVVSSVCGRRPAILADAGTDPAAPCRFRSARALVQ